MPNLHPVIEAVTERIRRRSRRGRRRYLDGIARAAEREPRSALSCGNLAHGVAACPGADKHALARGAAQNIAIVSAYNDVLSAHQPLGGYPELLKRAAREAGGVAQFAGGVPAMCDGVTQGRPGMELSLLSRDVIAQSAAIALSHDLFDGALLLGVCDKIVPGLCIAALAFGHLPVILVPAGPMPSGLPNRQKAKVREAFAQGRADRAELLRAEQASYHSPGTCTFYGTANTNQMLMEFMGLHLPGASFVNPGTPLREALTAEAARRVLQLTRGRDYTPVGRVLDERIARRGAAARGCADRGRAGTLALRARAFFGRRPARLAARRRAERRHRSAAQRGRTLCRRWRTSAAHRQLGPRHRQGVCSCARALARRSARPRLRQSGRTD